MTQNSSATPCTDILGTLPFEQGFHFCLEGGNYMGITTTKMKEFTEDLKTINQNSIDFHMQRKDFQKCIQNEFCDQELTKKIDPIREENLQEATLRHELLETVKTYLKKWQSR